MSAERTTGDEDPFGWLRAEFAALHRRLDETRDQGVSNGYQLARLEEQVKGMGALVESRQASAAATCAARHESTSKKIDGVKRVHFWAAGGIIAVAVGTLWDRVFPK